MNRWKILVDGEPFWNAFDDSRQIEDPVLDTEVNRAGVFSFTIRPDNPYYDAFIKLRSEVTVKWGSILYFQGRVLNEEYGFYNEKKIYCESELAYLNDIVVRPFEFPAEGQGGTPGDYLAFLLDQYNREAASARKIHLGAVTVEDPNGYIARSDTEYSTVWRLIQEGLLDTVGGYVQIRHATVDGQDVRYLDYFASLTTINQTVEFGKNLLDIMTEKRGEEVCTAILPLGAKPEDSETRITIAGLADDSSDASHIKKGDLIYNANAEIVYGGRIVKTVVWDDVTLPVNLRTKAIQKLAEMSVIQRRTTLTVADLSGAGVTSENPFRSGVLLRKGKSKPHEYTHEFSSNSENYLLIEKCSLPLFRPQDANVSVGAVGVSLTASARRDLADKVRNIYSDITIGQTQAIDKAVATAQSRISQSAEDILFEVSSTYATTSALQTVEEELKSTITQTAKDITAEFTKIVSEVPTFSEPEMKALSAIVGYIKAGILSTEGGNNDKVGVEIGQTTIVGSTETFKAFCQLVADSLIFYNGSGVALATFSGDYMNVNAAKIDSSMKLGNYEIDTSNGGWTLRWKPS